MDDKHGKGVDYYPNGTRYDGEFDHNIRSGFGELIYEDGAKYRGGWKDNKQHGKGMYVNPDGSLSKALPVSRQFNYEGSRNPQSDLALGDGEAKYPDGSTYKGQFRDGKKHGHGYMMWPDGDDRTLSQGGTISAKYNGEWRGDLKHGHGVYYYANGNVFEGNWVDGKRCGKGIFIYPDGKQFEVNIAAAPEK
jgi:hypothetical protein